MPHKDPEQRKAYAKAYRESHREKAKEYAKRYNKVWATENKDKCRAASQRYRETHREQVNEEQRGRYRDNPEKYQEKAREYRKQPGFNEHHRKRAAQRRQTIQELINPIKTKLQCQNPSCVCKGMILRPHYLDFHHVNEEEKLFQVSSGLTRGKEAIEAEMRKCTILCAFCHRDATWHDLDCSTFPRVNETLPEIKKPTRKRMGFEDDY